MSLCKYANLPLIFAATALITLVRCEFDDSLRVQRQVGAGEPCKTSTGGDGICVPLKQCAEEAQHISRRRPAVCHWETFGPVICCPSPNNQPSTLQASKPNVTETDSRCGLPAIPTRRARQTPLDGEEATKVDPKAFVIGGEDSKLGKWPWMATIFVGDDRRKPLCGATLISETVAVSAAHCFLDLADAKFVVGLGVHNIKESANDVSVKEVKVKKVIQHKDYKPPSIYNDIALLIFESKVTLSDRIQIVCLPTAFKNDAFVRRKVTVTGWGQKEFGGAMANILQEVDLTVFSNADCSNSYKTLPGAVASIPNGIIKSVVCAGSSTEAKDACPGDSGGPLVFQTSKRNWVLVGVVSAGYNCGEKIPGLYTRVTEYLDWITSNLA